MRGIIVVFLIAVVGARLFDWFSLPIPWLLGPIFFVLASQFVLKIPLVWPSILRNTGLVIVGVAIGQQFDVSLFSGMGVLILYMGLLNIGLALWSILLAYGTMKWTKMSFKTALTSSIPGGLSQLVLFAEEEQDIDVAVVTFFHVVRVIGVVLFVPFIVSGHVVTGGGMKGTWSVWLVVVLLLAAASVVFGIKFKMPVPHFLTPILFIIVMQGVGIETPVVPIELLHMAQLFIGAYIGLLLKPSMIRLPGRVLVGGVFSSVLLIGGTFLTAEVLRVTLHYSFATSFLSTAPGGLDQMGILAASVGADLSIVTVFQLFRLLFIFLIILPLLKLAVRKWLV